MHCARWERSSETFTVVSEGVSAGNLLSRVLSMYNVLIVSKRLESVFGVELPVLLVRLCDRMV